MSRLNNVKCTRSVEFDDTRYMQKHIRNIKGKGAIHIKVYNIRHFESAKGLGWHNVMYIK